MEEGKRPHVPAWLLASALVAVAALLWRVAVEPIDEGYVRYLGIADEMVRSGDWVVLRRVDDLYLSKPPLFIWLLALPIALLGHVPHWVPHLPDLLALVIALVAIHRLARNLYGAGEPPLAAIIVFASTWETFQQATGKRIDPLFAALFTAALAAFFLGTGGVRGDVRRGMALAGSWIFLALATLVKGPLAVLFYALAVIPFAAWTRRLGAFVSVGSLLGFAAFVGLCAAWPILIVDRLGFDVAWDAYSGKAFTTRRADLGVYLRSLPVVGLPWSLFYPALALALVRRRDVLRTPGFGFLALWFLALFVPLHLSEARHPRYLIPATPALTLALLSLWYAPRGVGELANGTALAARRVATRVWLLALLVVGTLSVPAAALLEREPVTGHPIPGTAALAAALGLVVAIAAVPALRSLRRGGAADASPLPLGALALLAFTVVSVLAAGEFRSKDRTHAAREALAPVSGGAPAAILGLYEEQQQLTRLLTQRDVPWFKKPDALRAWLAGDARSDAWIVTDAAGRRALAETPGLRVRTAADFELAQEPVELVRVEPAPDDSR